MNAPTALVSIIMPVFNGEAYLKEAIDSVLAQTYPHWELVVIDDGSVDETAHIVKNYDDARVRYFFQANRGQTASLNAGLDRAHGDYITTLDADDAYPPHSLLLRAHYLDQHPQHGAVYGDGQYFQDGSGKRLQRFSEQMPAGVAGDIYDDLIVSPFYGTGASVMVRRSVLQAHNLRYDESVVWCQDWDFYIRLAACTAFGFVDALTVFYRIHDSSMTVSMPEGKRLDSLVRTREKVLSSPRFRQVSLERQTQFLYDFLLNNLQGQPQRQEQLFGDALFRQLPARTQSYLMRQTAITYLLAARSPRRARTWLWRAWKKSPANPKTALSWLLSCVHPPAARRLIAAWQARQHVGGPVSPFASLLDARTGNEAML